MTARILLVEDDPVSSEVLASLLICRGYDVDQAGDGFSGLRMAREHSYDLVLVDYHLPEMDGYAFARLMRSLGEHADHPLAMVAITADRHGLAARRGVDGVFDKLLAKPLEPEELYACVEDVLCQATAARSTSGAIDAFLSEPTVADAHSASHVLWRVRGLADLPRAAVFPTPGPAEVQSLGYCFRVVDPHEADCLVLLAAAGLSDVARHRNEASVFLQPLVTLAEDDAAVGDAMFTVGDAASWTRVADVIRQFQTGRNLLRPDIQATRDGDLRLLAYLSVRGTALTLRRDHFGQTDVVNPGGFEPGAVIAAVKRLAAKGLIGSRPGDGGPDGRKQLVVFLTDHGQQAVIDPRCVRDHGATA